jgi:hypothetical protein
MNPLFEYHLHQTRRQFFASAGLSFCEVAAGRHSGWQVELDAL